MELNPLVTTKQLTIEQAQQAHNDFLRVRMDLWDFHYEIGKNGRVVDVYQKEKAKYGNHATV